MKTVSIETAIQALMAGKFIIAVDDLDRENEGDLIFPASLMTTEAMAFMIHHTSGIVCAALPSQLAEKFELVPMAASNTAPLGTPFTVSVDYVPGLTTGISAAERCETVRALANHNCGAKDFARPGHIFPLRAHPGGVLFRAGHTEAAVDLMDLAKLPPVGVLAELVNQDGTVKKGEQIVDFSNEHDIPIIAIDELIAYNFKRKNLVHKVAEQMIDTRIGQAHSVTFQTVFDEFQHYLLVFGKLDTSKPVPVLIHRENVFEDMFGTSNLIDELVEPLKENGCAVFLYLRAGASGVVERSSKETHEDFDKGEGHESNMRREQAWKEIGLGAQMLDNLGINMISPVKSSKYTYVGLIGFGITISP